MADLDFAANSDDSPEFNFIYLQGELDLTTTDGLAETLSGVKRSTVVDISAVTFMDSSGLAEFIQAKQRVEARGENYRNWRKGQSCRAGHS